MKKIEWLLNDAFTENNVPCPQAATKYVPKWYKEIPKLNKKYENESKIDQVINNKTIKTCAPFLDCFLSGYIQETWCDIYIEYDQSNDYVHYAWSLDPKIMSHRNNVSSEIFSKDGTFYKTEFVWQTYWMPKLPSGYSMLFTHPFNRLELPFYSLSGIIDNDKFFGTPNNKGNFPFYIKRGFSGIIPAGTPMYQMIPIKRERWKSDNGSINNYKQISPKKFFIGGYKKLYWQKKEYQ